MWLGIFLIVFGVEVLLRPRVDVDIGNKQVLLWFNDLDNTRKFTVILWW